MKAVYSVAFFVVLCFLFLTKAQRQDIKRLKQRLNLLERKVSFDSDEFRQDIDFLMSGHNNTAKCAKENSGEGEAYTDSQEHFQEVKELSGTSNDLLQILINGFKNEKHYLRRMLTASELSITKVQEMVYTRLDEMMDTLDDTIVQYKDQRDEYMNGLEALINNTAQEFRKEIEKILSLIDISQKEQTSRLEKQLFAELSSFQEDLHVCNGKSIVLEGQIEKLWKVNCESMSDWIYYDKACYFLSKKKLSWEDARTTCENQDAVLVEIENEPENDFLLNHWARKGLIKGSSGPWIGASDIEEEGSFIWVNSGRPLDSGFQHWGSGEPNGGRSENCLHKASWKSGWNDASCDIKTTFTCKKTL